MSWKECLYGANIYDRQERIKGWKQRNLKKARISLIGCDYISQFLLAAFAGLGIGHERENGWIMIFGNGKVRGEEKVKYPFYLEARIGEEKVLALEKIGKRMNPNLSIKGVNWLYEGMETFLGGEDLIVEATNDLKIKEKIVEFSNKNRKPLISSSCDKSKIKIFFNFHSNSNPDFSYFENKKQNIVTAELAAGIIADEVRKFFNPLKDDLAYDKKEFEFQLFENPPEEPRMGNSNILMAGFGTGGCWEGPVYACLGVKEMSIVDPDFIEPTNLNRQWLFYCSVGRRKVEVGKERLEKINPKLKIEAYAKRFEELDDSVIKKANVIVEGVDSFESRYEILKKSLEFKIPYVSSGVTFDSARVVTTYPGKTSDLDEVLGISRLIKVKRASCAWERNPSIVTTNIIASALSASETLKILDERYGEPFDGIIRYESNSKNKIFFQKIRKD